MGLPAGGVRVLALGAGGWPFRGTSRGRVVGRRRRGIATANDDEDETEPDERMALSRLQSSLWPARHAARWQASLPSLTELLQQVLSLTLNASPTMLHLVPFTMNGALVLIVVPVVQLRPAT